MYSCSYEVSLDSVENLISRKKTWRFWLYFVSTSKILGEFSIGAPLRFFLKTRHWVLMNLINTKKSLTSLYYMLSPFCIVIHRISLLSKPFASYILELRFSVQHIFLYRLPMLYNWIRPCLTLLTSINQYSCLCKWIFRSIAVPLVHSCMAHQVSKRIRWWL